MSTNRSNARASLCSFTFDDGRQCRTPRGVHPYLCTFHARKDAQALAADAAGKDIAYHLSGAFVSACDLSSALGRLFQTLPLAKHEYINAYGTDTWRDTIRTSHEQTADYFADNPSPNPQSPGAQTVPRPTTSTESDASPAKPTPESE
jgi:hypothetical protein